MSTLNGHLVQELVEASGFLSVLPFVTNLSIRVLVGKRDKESH